ncbi:TRAFAC clade GTPase domain-containing protein [Dyadobacter frigoris]|uniref:Double-GTPase 2 domain-containing protein n=1 Tax=Dyadobacter frigoris TaxID=2576211 RepID=A0A4U6D901_9BACT|nr:hypothetical protein [Dyadobacter frigoris]TKT90684.1 hypothetical protein FDK13_20420 [Dyadobacter frigoris]
MNNLISVSVLGVSKAGKTSCLVSMLDHFKKDFFENIDLHFTIDALSQRILMEQRGKLISSLDKGAIESTNGIRSTREVTKYNLKLGQKGSDSESLMVEFIDYPGSWLNNGNSADFANVKQFAANSQVLIIPIDSAYLMEMNDDTQPDIILEILKDVYADLSQPRLVIFTPIKCEKYYGTNDSNRNKAYHALLLKIQEKYENVLSFLTDKSRKKNISIVIIPMQTLGSCKLMYFSEPEYGVKDPVFVVTQRGVYSPKNTDQPFLYLLSFILKNQYESKNTGFPGFVRRLLKNHKYLNVTSEQLLQLCSNTNGIKVLQNSHITTF